MIPDVFPLLTQVFFVSSVVMTPLMILSLIYGKITGQIVFRVKEGPSLFERKQPNPAVRKEMPWFEEQKRLFQTESSNVTSEAVKTPNTEASSVKDFSPTGDRRVVDHTETVIEEPVEESVEEEEKEEEEEDRPFNIGEKFLLGEVTEDVERETADGIPVTIKKGTAVKVLLPGFTIEEIEDQAKVEGKKSVKEEKKKAKDLEKLSKDPDLGTVS